MTTRGWAGPCLDLRLAVPALAAWSGAALGGSWSGPPAYGAGAVLVLAGGACALAGRPRTRRSGRPPGTFRLGPGVAGPFSPRRGWQVWAAGLVCVGAGLVAAGTRTAVVDGSPVAGLAANRAAVAAELVVVTDPARHDGTVVGARRFADGVRFTARLERVAAAGRAVRVRVPVMVLAGGPGWIGRLPGERLGVRGRLAPASGGAAAWLRAEGRPRQLARAGPSSRLAGRLRAGLREAAAVLPPAERGLLPGLVVGDTSELDPALRDRFRRSGLSHLVAVSGTNCAIVLAAALALARRARAGPRTAAVIACSFLGAFVVVARPSPSVLRAATMGALALVAVATGRERSALRVLCASVLGLVLVVPGLARSPGFALSCAATAGLLLLAPPCAAWLARSWPPWLAEAVAVPMAAQLACAPLLAALAGGVSLVAIPANVLALPAVGPATVGGVAVAMLAPIAPPAARLAARMAGVPTAWLVFVADRAAALPGGQLAWPRGALGGLLLLAGLLTAGLLLVRRRPRRLAVAAVAGAVVCAGGVRAVAPDWPPRGWRFAACDVGQGDALVVRGAESTVVVDAGPDPDAVDACLRSLRVRRIAVLVLTHLHADHVEGVPGVLRGRHVGEVVVGPLDEPADELVRVRGWATTRRLPLRRARAGEAWRLPGLDVAVLGPAAAFRGTASDPNNSSLVLHVRMPGLAVLLTGDVEEPAQQALLDAGAELAADVVKVPHHGSARQVARFLALTGAAVAVVSVGRSNPYGHPAASTVAAIRDAGMLGFRTDRDGAVALGGRAGSLRVTTRGLAGGSRAAVPSVPVAWWCPVGPAGRLGPAPPARPRGPPPRSREAAACDPVRVSQSAPAPLTLVLGDEELLVSRAVAGVVAAVRSLEPEADVRDLVAADLSGLLDLMTPSLFGELRLAIVRGAHELSDDVRDGLLRLAGDEVGAYVLLVHPGGQKGRKLVELCKAAGAKVVPCAKVDKVGDRISFVQAEFAAAGRQATPAACRAIVEAVGGDLRELSAACGQLAYDTAGTVDERAVARYFRGRADASGFVVADRALEGDVAGALTELRLARQAGVDPVLVVAALARQVRTVARVASAGRSAPEAVGRELKLAPWMVDKARRQSRGWTPATLAAAHRAVAAADAEVKGGGSDPAYAIERAVLVVASGRGGRS